MEEIDYITIVFVLDPVYRYNLYIDVDIYNEYFFDLYEFLKVGWHQAQNEFILGWKEGKGDVIAVAITILKVNTVLKI